MYGIPNMKLDKNEVVLRRISLLEAEGVTFKCGVNVGVDISPEQLRKEFDSVILTVGATKGRDLPLPGRDAKGVHLAMEFLAANTKNLLDGLSPDTSFTAKGKDVVIIGGGDTGTDCVGTSLRHGCKSVIQLEIMAKSPLTRAKDNPWPEWPKTYKVDYGQEEAAAKFGSDPRVYLTTATKFDTDTQGNLQAVHTVEVEWKKNDKGVFGPQPIAGTEKVRPAQIVLLAMGFMGPEQPLIEAFGLERDARSNVKAEHEKYVTNLPGVFAAGDCRRGQSLVVWAFNEGRGVARECDKFLMGKTELP
jgi:glutamate synthase (NADPH/NADH) small chain